VKRIPSPWLVVIDRHHAHRPVEQVVAEAVSAGARWVWLRDRDLDLAERRSLALRLVDIVQGAGGLLSIGGDVALAAEIGTGGAHARALSHPECNASLNGLATDEALDVLRNSARYSAAALVGSPSMAASMIDCGTDGFITLVGARQTNTGA
jgi:thiamine-phosphate pyrophosphorylase